MSIWRGLLAFAVAGVSSCGLANGEGTTGGTDRLSQSHSPSAERTARADGVAYLVLDGEGGGPDLFRLDLSSSELTRLTTGKAVYEVSASSELIAVNAAVSGVSAIYTVGQDGELSSLHGDEVRGATPDVDGSRVRYVSPRLPDARVLSFDSRSGELSVVFTSSASLAYAELGPASSLVTMVNPGNPGGSEVILLDASGAVVSRRNELFNRALVWGNSSCYAVSDRIALSALVTSDAGARTPLPPRWVPLAFSPSGWELLVSRGRDLGVIDLRSLPLKVNRVWHSSVGDIESGDWIESRTPSERSDSPADGEWDPAKTRCRRG